MSELDFDTDYDDDVDIDSSLVRVTSQKDSTNAHRLEIRRKIEAIHEARRLKAEFDYEF